MGSPKNPEQILIALEPEAAAISCLEKNMSDFQSETGSTSVESLLSQPDTHYMVADIGGNFQLSLLFNKRKIKLSSKNMFELHLILGRAREGGVDAAPPPAPSSQGL